MQNNFQSSAKSIRLNHISTLRDSMKKISLISQKTIRLEGKLKQIEASSLNKIENQNSTQDIFSIEQSETKQFESSPLDSFLEQYEIMEKLGEGANASVYKCMHKASKKLYALKKIRIQEEHVLEIKQNFQLMKKMNHPSIIKYHAHCLDEKKHCSYLVMELFAEPTLLDLDFKDEDQIRFIAKKLIKAIRYMHNRNLCHRDIKPENILYSRKEKIVKIVDFGICKKTFQRGSRRQMLTIIGTPFYLAPEVYIGGGYDETVDNWALGITLYKLITGSTPFQDVYHSDTIANIVKAQPSFNEEQWGKFSSQLKDFVSKLITKKEQRMTLKQALRHAWLKEESLVQRKSLSQEKQNLDENISYSPKHRQINPSKVKKFKSYNFELTDQEAQLLSPTIWPSTNCLEFMSNQ